MESPVHSEGFHFPSEVVAGIFRFLDYRCISIACCVSKHWLDVALHDSQLWAWKFERDFGANWLSGRTLGDYDREWKIRNGRPVISTSWVGKSGQSRWKFKDNLALGAHSDGNIGFIWCVDLNTASRTAQIDIQNGALHVACNASIIVVAFRNGCIGCWDFESHVHIETFHGHESNVWCVDCDEKIIASGGKDKQLKIWDAQTRWCVHTIEAHDRDIYHLQIMDKYVVSGSWDATMKVWDRGNWTCLATLRNTDDVSYVACNDKLILSGCDCGEIKTWDAETFALVVELRGHHNMVDAMYLHGEMLVSADFDGCIKMWDLRNGKCIRSSVQMEWGVNCIGYHNGTFLFGLYSSRIGECAFR